MRAFILQELKLLCDYKTCSVYHSTIRIWHGLNLNRKIFIHGITSFNQQDAVNLQLFYKKQSILSDTPHPHVAQVLTLPTNVLSNQNIFTWVSTKSKVKWDTDKVETNSLSQNFLTWKIFTTVGVESLKIFKTSVVLFSFFVQFLLCTDCTKQRHKTKFTLI